MEDPLDDLTLGAGRTLAEWISRALGWSYVSLWAVSFIPQILHSWKTRQVSGVSSDFIGLNVAGFLCYFSATTTLLLSTEVRKEYADRHDGFPPLARWNDAAFAAWASLCALTQLGQAIAFRATANPVSRITSSTLVVIALSVLSGLALTSLSAEAWWGWLDFVNFLFYIKIYITLVKYIPQVSLNYQRHSTIGFRVENLLADLGGGLLSLAQLVLDAALAGDWTGITGHPAKLGIALIALLMDGILISQWATYDKSPRPSTIQTPRDIETAPSEPTEETTLIPSSRP